jgi:hypothetical protein
MTSADVDAINQKNVVLEEELEQLVVFVSATRR